MSENERQNISETFGRFTESSSIGGQHNMNGPRNVTSDMWAPISVGRTAEPQSKVRQNTDAGVQKREEKPVSTEKKRPDANKSKAPVKSAQRSAEKGRNSAKKEKKPVVLEAIEREDLTIVETIHQDQWVAFVVEK